ncbi:MAG: hypothetical protein ACO36I_02450, partial [Candidatus Latescibacterota bacterium]
MKIYWFFLFSFFYIGPLHAQTGDLNSDNKVDFSDFLIFATNFGKTGEPNAECGSLVGDFNCDNKVDFSDFVTFASNFGTTGNDNATPTRFYAPQTFAEILATNQTISWTPHTQSLGNLTRISLGVANTQDLIAINDNSTSYAATFTIESGLATSTTLPQNTLLKSMFKLIEISSNTYMIISPKHANYAVDYATIAGTPTLVMRDIRSYFLNTTSAAFLTFTITTSNGTTQITANRHYTYNAATSDFVADSTWAAMHVAINGSAVVLSPQTGTPFILYQAPLEQDIPIDFN